MREVRVIFEEDAKKDYIKLNKIISKEKQKGIKKSIYKTLFNSISKKIDLLKINPQLGRAVKKSLIPKKYKEKGITNLWIINLPNYWRLLYNIQTNEVQIICFILEFGDHNKYNKLFNFKKK